MPENLQFTLAFLHDLAANNNKVWFDANRARYDKARGYFEDFITDLIHHLDTVEDLSGVTTKDCIFRINRDVRFSADKSPYKSTMSALIARGGRKATGRSYYIHLEPDGKSMLAGGIYAPTSVQLEKLRRSIAEDSKPLKKILANKDFLKYFKQLDGESLKTAPQGYTKDHPDIALIRLKQFVVHHPLSQEQITAPDLVDHLVTVCKALKPLLVYLYDTADA